MIGTAIGSHAPDFELPGIDDRVHHLARYLEEYRGVGVIFLCNRCAYVQSYLDRLKQIQTDFNDKGFTLIGINSNDARQYPEDSFEQMKSFAQERDLNFPYLRDATQDVAHCFGVQKTSEVFLLDGEGILRYRGSIDDHPHCPEEVESSYLREAIASLLSGETVAIESTEAIGGSLRWHQKGP
ncbi:thioredoxin family protein [Laspinema olomoucense]|uniref:thioredoxin family protein n=1 Tax=Laspinema olomoucense TaxID=3231600 RepID=UPI0021BB2DEA|nr:MULTISPECIES: thioredoxin family protein [unclassified Laspinema]MCT7971519.1 thioredoxin family protein [Laspinema sp. D3d]MCT7990957.1 thioredoxin family protein [Laspinema sp. D3a]MCT7995440.1 thioredoxin family protein [Laspinema sp. D3c]